ncbi:serine hydrolase domain-containing protein [Jannaschia donghaensis]|uniref:Beta-lactamase n=1 Tax=Jannaschia donghaensis TaxID=420998 RepID=A0A0M6YGP1_9RHOB|nr:serine hydrolase domain-containing protein [Jannaschia donghaensis]CTQ48246.1 Beta-lactamase [Jannaschia donghaensis]
MIFTAHLTDDGLIVDDAPPLPWWSISKTMLAALCVKAHVRGDLDLDVPCAGRPWTLRDLLEHRAGLGDYGPLPAYRAAVAAGKPVWSTNDFLAAVPPDFPDAPPQTRFSYSNIGYLLARQALESATGRTFADLLTDLTVPFGLDSVRLATLPEDFADLPFRSDDYHPGWVAHGCVIGTPGDAVRLLQLILTDPGLAPMQAAKSLPFHDPARVWTSTGYGLGLMIGTVGSAGRALGHSGGGPFSACAAYAFPDLPGAPITAAFVSGGDEAPAEHHALRHAIGA